ncbi:MAG: type I DNA topoisomerase [Ruminococcaceae bacterium]|nr:type I DNA topoisomerase [Oscillospiraceae bacterium]
MANLVIVESPSKAAAIKKYLGSNYKVVASKGHVRDLPKSTLSVDIENGFEAHYINIRGKGDLIKDIRREAKAAKKVFLAPDPDREGEAIAWHLAIALGLDPAKTLRVTFNEITPDVVRSAIKSPRAIDMNLVNAQQTRRIWDRVVGYKLSPYLWKSVKNGLSAGRVQSVASRIIVDREEEIRAFEPEEYWTIDASLNVADRPFSVRFYGNIDGKIKLGDEAGAKFVVDAVRGKAFEVKSIKRATRQKLPAPPFTTSTMQQEASRKLGFQSQRIMRVAQELYEGVNVGTENGGVQGLITYMRTDSLRVSVDAQNAARELISSKYGEQYCPKAPRTYKAKAGAQDAHEAIRPANVALDPATVHKYLTPDQYRLYKLIWERFVASQMENATLNTQTLELVCAGYTFRTSGYSVAFPGYMAVYEESEDEQPDTADAHGEQRDLRLPDLAEGQMLEASSVVPQRHFTEPPARYTEASLIKFLDEKGIGRPSTYNTIITTIVSRNYVTRDGKSLVPTPLGEVTTQLMKKNFPDIVDYAFTAQMETELDEIEEGNAEMVAVLDKFWQGFSRELESAEVTIGTGDFRLPVEQTDIICDKCGAKMVVKNGRYGKFAACPNYPTCKNTKPLESEKPAEPVVAVEKAEKKAPVVADFKCELCGGDMVQRTGRFGSFFACANYPTCTFTKQKTKELDVPCPKCGARVLIKTGRNKTVFYSCERYPDCDFSSWDMPTAESCPDCGKLLFRKKGKALLVCHDKACGYRCEVEESAAAEKGE